MNYVRRKMFALVAAAVFAMVYYPLKDFAFAVDLAVCASYTVTVFIKVRGKRGKAGMFTGKDAIPVAELLLVHLVALACIIGVVRLGIYAAPVLPGWLTSPIGSSPAGRPLPSPLRYFQTGMLFLVGFIEFWWLTQIKTDEEKEQQGRIIRGKNAYEEDLINRLRLR